MTEKGYMGGVVSRVRNIHSDKRYVISTAQEIGQDYWTTIVCPGLFFGFFPNLSKNILAIVRNNKEDAHEVHWRVKEVAINIQENDWLREMPRAKPPEGWSTGAKEKMS